MRRRRPRHRRRLTHCSGSRASAAPLLPHPPAQPLLLLLLHRRRRLSMAVPCARRCRLRETRGPRGTIETGAPRPDRRGQRGHPRCPRPRASAARARVQPPDLIASSIFM